MADDGQDTGDYGKHVPVEPHRAHSVCSVTRAALFTPSLYAEQSGAFLIARIEGPQLHWWGLSEHKEYLAASLSPLHLLLQPPYNAVFFNLTHWLSSHLGNLTSAYRTG